MVWLLLACTWNPASLEDNVASGIHLGGGTEFATPYVKGAQFTISGSHGQADLARWKITSSDERVIELSNQEIDLADDQITTDAVASGEGTTTIALIDEHGDARLSEKVTVFAANGLQIHDPMASEVSWEGLDSHLDVLKVLVGGEGSFDVQWFAGTTRLSGAGALGVDGQPGLEVEVGDEGLLVEDKDQVVFMPTEAGSYSVPFLAAETVVETLVVEAVREIASMEVLSQPTSGVDEGDIQSVYVRAFDEQGDVVRGVPFEVLLDGELSENTGDRISYRFDAAQEKTLTIRYGSVEQEVVIHASGLESVNSTSNLGCSMTGQGPSCLWLGLGVLAIRRRSRS